MRFIRRLTICLLVAIALVAILAIAAFVPAVQTSVARMMLPERLGLRVSSGSLSAGFTGGEVTELSLEWDGAILKLPALEARFPLSTAVWKRTLKIRSLVAKGWTLDLSRRSAPAVSDAPAPAVVSSGNSRGKVPVPPSAEELAREAVRDVREVFSDWKLPDGATLDGVDLEGDVLIAVPLEPEPVRVHVKLKGGGIAAGHTGEFTVDAAAAVADPSLPLNAISAHGRFVAGIGASRSINRLEITTGLSAEGGSLPKDLTLSAAIARPDGASEAALNADLSSGIRHLAAVRAGFSKATHRFEGTWNADLRDIDLAGLFPRQHFPTIAAAGDGHFDVDAAFSQTHVTGQLKTVASRLGAFAPELDRIGEVTLDNAFDLTRGGGSIRVARLSVAVFGPRRVAEVTSLQPFRVEEKTGKLKADDPLGDWLEVSMSALPLGWLGGWTGGWTLAGGDVIGELRVRATDDGVAVSSPSLLVANGVAVANGERVFAEGLNLSCALNADYSSKAWHVRCEPLTIAKAGRPLVNVDGKASRAANAGRAIALDGTWRLDLAALAAVPTVPGAGWIRGRSASGDFSASVGTSTDVKGKVNILGRDPTHALAADLHAVFGSRGGVSFRAPVTLALGKKTTEFTVEGSWLGGKAGSRVDATVTGVKVDLEPFGLLAPAFSAATRGGAPSMMAVAPDQQPFWGDWSGRVDCNFYQLRVGEQEITEVAGRFDVDPTSIRLTGGRGKIAFENPAPVSRSRGPARADPTGSVAKVEGALIFSHGAESAYSVKVTGAVDSVDAGLLFPAPKSGGEPVLKGRFSVVGTLTGSGRNLDDLIARRQEEFRFASTGGILRLLNTSVASSIPQVATPVSDALATVGNAVGSLFKLRNLSLGSATNPVSKNAEAVLDFTSLVAEIGYEQAAVTAIRGADRTIHLVDFLVSAADERLTGSGQIAAAPGLALAARPLSLDLKYAARGRLAELLATAGLVAPVQDKQAYATLDQPVHFGGTLAQIDGSQWHELLVKAATHSNARSR